MTACKMAYTLRCDIEACGAEIESGSGQPTLQAKRHLYCPRCQSRVAAVEAEVRKRAIQMAVQGQQEIERLREELMAAMMPPQLGGSGKGLAEWPEVKG